MATINLNFLSTTMQKVRIFDDKKEINRNNVDGVTFSTTEASKFSSLTVYQVMCKPFDLDILQQANYCGSKEQEIKFDRKKHRNFTKNKIKIESQSQCEISRDQSVYT